MKKTYMLFVFLCLFCFFVSADSGEQEEIDFLLFFPNSSSRFVNENQAGFQLDNLAKYLTGKAINPGQILIYGYAANAVNNIDPVRLSRERALHVIGELKKRGVPGELFSDPVAYGAVDLWGRNTNEQNRIPNRRVRILLDGEPLTPETLIAAEPEIAPVVETKSQGEEPAFKFPWKVLLPLLLLALVGLLVYLLSKSRKKAAVVEEAPPAPVPEEPKPPIVPIPAPVAPLMSKIVVNLEEEIRFRAYELNLERNGQNGDMDGDWYKALPEVCSRYEKRGYEVYTEDGSWWARKSFVR